MEKVQEEQIGKEMYELAERLFPICRSITGNGVRETLAILREYIPDLKISEVPSGTPVFDWTVPKEWNITEAYIENSGGERIVDFKDCNLHVVGYSVPVDCHISRKELMEHVYVEETQPDAVPYVTSYYKERWGFCMTRRMRDALPEDTYHCVIKSTLEEGSLTYAQAVIPGETQEEILLSTYVCHPSMANNELSGPVVQAFLYQWLKERTKRRYTYRLLFLPETIGSITYISQHMEHMKAHIKAGFLLSCVGDERTYSYIPTRKGGTLADRTALKVLQDEHPDFVRYTFLDRGSDERQYNAPGVDIPVCGICRSKYGVYPEYHTSLDNMELISPRGLAGSYALMTDILTLLEYNLYYKVECFCEPQLGKRGLQSTISRKGTYDGVLTMRDLIAYADGETDLIEISETIGVPAADLYPLIDRLMKQGLLTADSVGMISPAATE